MTEQEIEQEILVKNLTAPRVTIEHINNCIVKADFYTFPNTTVTICCLTLTNGFTIIGESACADIRNFDKALGQEIAKTNARDKIWSLEGYLLRQKLFENN